MSFLTTLKFTTIQDVRPSPIERRRMRLVENLKQQIVRLRDPTHALTSAKWVKDDQGKRLIERVVPVRPWWREMPDGSLAFVVKTGLKMVEFKKGQSAILVENKDALPALIEGLIDAANKGEFDQFLHQGREVIPPQRKKAA
jgi:hypothetical protein